MKIAMVGAGYIAGVHLSAFAQMKDVEVVGHVSPIPAEREAAQRRWGGSAYATCEELLAHEQVEAAWITIPPGSHGAIEQGFIERRIPMFIEKPLSAGREPAEKIAQAIAKAGLIAGVGYHWRAMDTIPMLKQKLAEKPPQMVVAAWHDATPPPDWWHHQQTSGGQMVEQATHLFDIARHLVGEASVVASQASRLDRPAYNSLDVATVGAALLEYKSGVKGVFTATCLVGFQTEVFVKFVCDELLITLTQTGLTFDTGNQKIEYKCKNNPFLAENVAFVESIRQNKPELMYCSYADALLTHHLTSSVLEKSGYVA